MGVGSGRRSADLAAGFTRWLAAKEPTWQDVHVTVGRPTSGLSSDTVFFDVDSSSGHVALVARLPPTGSRLFPDYSLERQARVQQALMGSAVPVARVLTLEPDDRWLGAAFLLMERVAGRTLPTMPNYVTAGWLRDADAASQTTLLRHFVEMLATIHAVDPAVLPDGTLSGGGPDLGSALDWWSAYLDWASDDEAAAAPYRDGLAWCRDHLPPAHPGGLLWGDPELVNVVFGDDLAPAAVLDWEMATTGPTEIDLGWFFSLHDIMVSTAGGDLPGFPERHVVIGWYEAASGRTVGDLRWYEVFGHVRSGAIVLRSAHVMRAAGIDVGWAAHTPQPRHIRRLTA